MINLIDFTKYKNINKYRNEIKSYYYIDEKGNIFSTFTNKFIKPKCDKDGYLRVALACNDPSIIEPKYKLIGIHSLVNLCFNGQPPMDLKKPTTDHIDGNRQNNYYKNLRWVEDRINASYDLRHKDRNDDLPDEEIPKIFKLYKSGMTCEGIAKLYNTSFRYIHHILIGKKRIIGLEKYNLKPIEVKKMLNSDEVMSICFELLDNKYQTFKMAEKNISEKYNVGRSAIEHIRLHDSWKEITKFFDFKNKTITLFDDSPDISLSSELTKIGDTVFRYE